MADTQSSGENRAWQRRGGNSRGEREYDWDKLPPDVPQSIRDEVRELRELARRNLDPTLQYFPVAPKKKRIWIMWAIVVTQNPDGTWKVGKVPHIATSNGGRYKAASDNPSNWHTLKDAQAAYRLNGDQR